MKKILLGLLVLISSCNGNPAFAVTQTPAANISVVTSSFVNCLSSQDSNVQISLQDIDNCLGPLESVIFNDSIVKTGNVVTLVNDTLSPGNTKYYGTDGGGIKGFFTVPNTPPGGSSGNIQANNGTGGFAGILNTSYDSNGNIGIATSSPLGSLEVDYSGTAIGQFSYANQTGLAGIGASAGHDFLAQEFIPTVNYSINDIQILLGADSPTPSGTLIATIETNSTSCSGGTFSPCPSGTLVNSNATVAITTSQSSYNTWTFPQAIPVVAGTIYWIKLTPTSYSPGGWQIRYGNTGPSTNPAFGYQQHSGSTWLLNSGFSTNFRIDYTYSPIVPALIVMPSGNVGINSLYPGNILDVNGTARMTGIIIPPGSSNGYIWTASDSSGHGSWQPNAASGQVSPGTVNQTAYYSSTGSTISGSSTLIINGSNVGVGSTAPGQKLDVQGTIRTTAFNLSTSPSNGYIATSDAGGNMTWQPPATSANPSANVGLSAVNGSASTFMRSDAAPQLSQSITPTWSGIHAFTASPISATFSNNVGVGTINPIKLFQVAANDTVTIPTTATLPTISILNNNSATSGNVSQLEFQTADTNGAVVTGAKLSGIFDNHTPSGVSGELALITKNAGKNQEDMRITSNGNVGIGTATPGTLLDVQGTTRSVYFVGNTLNYLKNVSANYNIINTDNTVLVSGVYTITLPTAVGIRGQCFNIKNVTTGSSVVTVNTTSAQTIDGSTTYAIVNGTGFYSSVTVESDGSNWWVV